MEIMLKSSLRAKNIFVVCVCLAITINTYFTIRNYQPVYTPLQQGGHKWFNEHPFKYDTPPRTDGLTSCVIPYYPPLSSLILESNMIPPDHLVCSDSRDRLAEIDLLNRKLIMLEDFRSCSYEEAIRINDNGVSYQHHTKITSRETVLRLKGDGVQFLRVKCLRKKLNVTQLLLVDPLWSVARKRRKFESNRPNILMFGIDSVSRLSFIRYLPKTYQYLRDNLNAEIFQLHHKVGDNTYPNLMAILAGEQPDRDIKYTSYDEAPLMFYEFSRAGYETLYSEDATFWNTFNLFGRNGFKHAPTSHYLRQFWNQTEGNYDFDCYFNEPRHRICLRYLTYLLKRPRTPPLFLLNFFVYITHDREEKLAVVDDEWLTFFKGIEPQVSTGKTLLVVFSDHGPRFSALSSTFQGFVEGNLPFLAIATSNTTQRRMLNLNSKRLTSQFDLHETLRGILKATGYGAGQSPGIDLLNLEVPANRTCTDAGIDDTYCTCIIPHRNANTDIKSLSLKFIAFINKMLLAEAITSIRCSRLSLLKIESNFTIGKHVYLVLRTSPGNGLFQIRYDIVQNSPFQEKMIRRVNRYGTPCIDHDILRKYCHCA